MTSTQSLFYALGEMAYAIASADGAIQQEEKKMLRDILNKEFKDRQWDFDYSETIFRILEKDKTDLNTAYKWAINELNLNSYFLKEDMKTKFIKVVNKVAEAFPPVTTKERKIIDDFINELNSLKVKQVL